MTESKSYGSDEEFRRALEERIVREAATVEERDALRKEVAFERALARFDQDKWTVKGGYAVRLLCPDARHTIDIDMILKEPALLELSPEARAQGILARVKEQLSKDAGDRFVFEMNAALAISDLSPNNLAAVVLGKARIGDAQFTNVRIDVGIKEKELLEVERVGGHDLLGFAGVENPQVVVCAREEIFAEKFLAYLKQGETGERVKDMVDMEKLVDRGLNEERLSVALNDLARQNAVELPERMTPPPDRWQPEFERLATEARIDHDMGACHERLASFIEPVLERCRQLELDRPLDAGLDKSSGTNDAGMLFKYSALNESTRAQVDRGDQSSGVRAEQARIDSSIIPTFEDGREQSQEREELDRGDER